MTRQTIGTGVLSAACAAACAGGLPATAAAAAQEAAGTISLSRTGYAERLRGMWLGEAIANFTGLQTEHHHWSAPFYTDANWGTGPNQFDFVLRNPWPADDDTDIEYTYVHLLDQHQTAFLSPAQIRDGWVKHVNRSIWVSNAAARDLMGRGVMPGSTSLPAANPYSLMIDAQLTTEVFGALAPGRPDVGLRMALTPMLTTSRGHATHASQYFAALYGLAAHVPAGLAPAEQTRWLNGEARRFIPDSSKAADIVDFVTADFLANPDKDDWEATRDRIYDRYQVNAAANGFVYRTGVESSVNFATGVMALLYGQGDFKRTVRIGTLSGWDSDNPTATLGGLLGLLQGEAGVRAAFPSATLSEGYVPSSTRDALPDHTPGDPNTEDTFTLLAQRMLGIADRAVVAAGGQVNGDTWLIPTATADPLATSPTERIHRRSGNVTLREGGVTVTPFTSVTGQSPGWRLDPAAFADGVEHDFSGRDRGDGTWYSTYAPSQAPGVARTVGVLYGAPLQIDAVRFIEGDIDTVAGDDNGTGGWFESLLLELLVNGVWQPAPAGTTLSEPLLAGVPFQTIDFLLPSAMTVDGVRFTGPAGGTSEWASVSEIDALRTVPEPAGALAALAAAAAAGCRRSRRRG